MACIEVNELSGREICFNPCELSEDYAPKG